MMGRVHSIHWSSGYGFIRGDDNRDYFFSQSQIGLPAVGMRVEFEPIVTAKGLRARRVKKVVAES